MRPGRRLLTPRKAHVLRAQSRAEATSALAGNAGDPSVCGSREGCEVRALLGANSPLTPKTEPQGAAVQPCGPFGVAGSQGPSGLCMDGGLCCWLRVAETRDSNDTHTARLPRKRKYSPPGLGVISGMRECPRREGRRKPGCDGPVPATRSGCPWSPFSDGQCSAAPPFLGRPTPRPPAWSAP